MPRQCKACVHPKRDQLNQRLMHTAESGETLATIALAYGLSTSAIDRHRANHLKVSAALVSDARNALTIVGYAGDLYERINRLAARAESMLDEPLTESDSASRRVTAAVAAIRELRQSIDQLAKLVVTAPPEAQVDGNSWLDAAILEAVQSMGQLPGPHAALPSGEPIEAVIVQQPE